VFLFLHIEFAPSGGLSAARPKVTFLWRPAPSWVTPDDLGRDRLTTLTEYGV
jgi:hypothetical protein